MNLNYSRLVKYIDILLVLIYKEWIVKYKRTVLGFLWSIIYPIVLFIAFYIAFKVALKLPIKNFSAIVIPAVFVWQWFSNSVLIGQWAFIANAVIIKKYPVSKWLLVLAINLIDTIHFILASPIILLLIIINGFKISFLFIINYILLLIIQTLFNFSLALIFATLNVFFRDIDRLLLITLNILIFLTPVFYSLNQIPKEYRIFFYLNPLTPFMEEWRFLFLTGYLNKYFVFCLLYTIFFGFLAFIVYKKLSKLIPEVL